MLCNNFLAFLFFLLNVEDLGFLDQVFDLLFTNFQMVGFSLLVLVFQSELLHENSVWFSHIWEQECSRLTDRRSLEVDSEVSPLTFSRFGHVIHSADMEWHKLFVIDRNQDRKILIINEKLTSLHALWELFDG